MITITQDMKYKQSLMKYATVHGVSKASRKYNRARSYIYFWLNRWDDSIEPLRPGSRWPYHHPSEHTVKGILVACGVYNFKSEPQSGSDLKSRSEA